MVSEERNSEMELASEVIPVPQVLPEVQNVNNEELECVNNEAVNVNNEDVSQWRKTSRHRQKALCAAILKQMEFYFGDSNLSKDRFLAGLIRENPDVDIELFLKFNRIKTLTIDINLITKACRKSTMLKVSEDGKKVQRVTPIVEKQNVDECSVYIQGLPSDANHDWLTNLFSEYGPVAYVSIPKFKYNNKIKGFAFIEFETPESAEKCLKAFREKGSELPCQTLPTEVLSITTFNEEENQEKDNIKNPKKLKENVGKRVKDDEEHSETGETKIKKRKKNKPSKSSNKECETDESESIKSKPIQDRNDTNGGKHIPECDADRENNEEKLKIRKRKKKSIEHKDPEDDQSENSIEKKKKIKIESTVDSSLCLSDTAIEGEEKRGKKRKNRHSSEGTQETENETEASNKRKKVKSEKNTSEQESTENENDGKKENNESSECENKDIVEKKKKKKRKRNRHPHSKDGAKAINLGIQAMSKKSWKKLRNKYLELQRAKMKQLKQHMRNARWNQWGEKNKMEYECEENPVCKKDNAASNLEFIPGVIVKVELSQACVDPKGFKAEMRNHSSQIKYVDIKEGSNVAFVRCESSEAAKTLSEETSDEKCFKVLEGNEEKSYWDKIAMDRKEKIENKIRPKHRGRDKLLKKAEKELGKHIKFDEV